jgi:DNA-directed RNA polymerase subunit RPC12/RpoP
MTSRKISLKVIVAPATGHVLNAPPVVHASDHSIDYTCGHCGTTLLHAEENQVHGLLIHCTKCGSYNATEV